MRQVGLSQIQRGVVPVAASRKLRGQRVVSRSQRPRLEAVVLNETVHMPPAAKVTHDHVELHVLT
jgi:hypothetical protein